MSAADSRRTRPRVGDLVEIDAGDFLGLVLPSWLFFLFVGVGLDGVGDGGTEHVPLVMAERWGATESEDGEDEEAEEEKEEAEDNDEKSSSELPPWMVGKDGAGGAGVGVLLVGEAVVGGWAGDLAGTMFPVVTASRDRWGTSPRLGAGVGAIEVSASWEKTS